MLTLGMSASLGNGQVRSIAEGISRTFSSVPDTSAESRVGQAYPKWLKIDAFHVPVFSTPKMCGEVGTVAFFMLYKTRFETQQLTLDLGQLLTFCLSCPHWAAC